MIQIIFGSYSNGGWYNTPVTTTGNLIQVSFTVFPNPSVDGVFYISGENHVSHIAVYDMLGKKVFEARNTESSQNIIDLSNQQSGIYTVRMELNGKTYSLKLVKQ